MTDMHKHPFDPDERAEILKALSHPKRVEFLEWMRAPENHFASQAHPLEVGICAGQFEKCCGLSQSTVSQHLSVLEKAGLITLRRVGQWSFYHRNEDRITAFIEDLRKTL
ncbi:ArsR/SmtB family transcription factor [Neorhizobium sp. NPDC001467]|uniref:ArsR/SmtB family transcription factor n=1 Tax=Neorhizobium sp. NPDC001467 TaxID=3390595 RepID=UPI003CFDA732